MNSDVLTGIVGRALIGNPAPPRPELADLISLYLFLPVDFEESSGRVLEVRSALTSLLSESHVITGRDVANNVLDETKLGALLGAIGYLCLIDQAGKAVRWTFRDQSAAKTGFERILIQHGCDPDDAAACYALRNAMVHSYGLSNVNRDRPELQRSFELVPWGPLLVDHPDRPWDGNPNNVEGQQTTVSLQALGNLADALVFDLAETWATDPGGLVLAHGMTSAKMRRNYIYTRQLSP